ncbi:MAG: hypothetical protein ACTHYC_07815 [Sphingobacterium sp.]
MTAITKIQLRKQRLVLYFNDQEFATLKNRQESSNCPNMGIYFRTILFSPRKLVTFHRNSSQDDILDELARLRNQLRVRPASVQRLANSAPQATKEGNRQHLEDQKRLEKRLDEIKLLIKKLLTIWLQ